MQRPINISPLVYKFLKKEIESEEKLKVVLLNLIPTLISLDIMSQAETLLNCVFELKSGEEIIIDEKSIEGIRLNSSVDLKFIYDQKRIILKYQEFLRNFRESQLLDWAVS